MYPGRELFVAQGAACLGVYPLVRPLCGIDKHEDVVPEAYDSARDHVVCGDPLWVAEVGQGDELAGL